MAAAMTTMLLGPFRSQSLFQFVQISDAYFAHFSYNTPTCYSLLDSNLANLGPQLWRFFPVTTQ